MTRGVGGVSPSSVQRHLDGVSYPATKEDLLEAARRDRAPDEVVQVIERFDRDEYGGPQDVMEANGDLA